MASKGDDLTVYSGALDTSLHSISRSEERSFAAWMTRQLLKDAEMMQYRPFLAPKDADESGKPNMYDQVGDGIALCKLINSVSPNTIDERAINKPKRIGQSDASQLNVFMRNENLTLAIRSAESLGCCVENMSGQTISNGTRHIICGLIWQIVRNSLVNQINLIMHPELIALLRPGETLDDLKALTAEQLLSRWVNYHLEAAGVDKRIENFSGDIQDSEAYAHLLNQICPRDLRSGLVAPDSVLSAGSNMDRANQILANSRHMDVMEFVLVPEDIAQVTEKNSKRDNLNLAYVANLFNTYPGLDPNPTDVPVIVETLEEKTYKNWMNSLGIQRQITGSLYDDLHDGLIFLEVFDKINPGCVNWKVVTRKFDPKRRVFQKQQNCAEVVEASKRTHLPNQNLGGENIYNRERNFVLGLSFLMMRYYTLKLLMELKKKHAGPGDGAAAAAAGQQIEDKDIVAWVNGMLEQAGKSTRIKSFRDPAIGSVRPVFDLLDAIQPGCVNEEFVSGDSRKDAEYAVSVARKIGARVFCLPDHLMDVHQKMVMTMFACLMVRYYEQA